jgi:cytochrome P450
MDSYIGPELDKRFREHRTSPPGDKKNKAIIDLLLQAYSPNSEAGLNQNETMDPEFRLFAIRQIRMFVFAGHDSTSSAITYCFHLLSKHPKALARLRAEHDATYGSEISSVASQLLANPALANGLPYTTAVIKEALRLFPPASSNRQGISGVEITDDTGMVCPTNGAVVWVNHQAMHRASKYWVCPDEFIPERWLVGPEDELYPMKGAWRPFENGPRNCIGQGLVMMELRIVLSLTVREFSFRDAYEEFDAKGGWKGIKSYKGERVFQIDEGAAHPAEYYPCKVELNL